MGRAVEVPPKKSGGSNSAATEPSTAALQQAAMLLPLSVMQHHGWPLPAKAVQCIRDSVTVALVESLSPRSKAVARCRSM